MVDCEQTREELAVQALAGDRHGGPDTEISVHLGQCAECSAEQRRFAEVTLVLSRTGLPAFDGLCATGARTTPGTWKTVPEEAWEAAAEAWQRTCPRAGHTWHGTADRPQRPAECR
ncbi:hypothetical protein ACH4FA_34715 [Streptomyces sp. NPDC017966]|uniref:hypothetical protein n=1 Tax=Streptomyces sp. NPDC017966 TaxID=3365023 RepID=UPI0037A8CD17